MTHSSPLTELLKRTSAGDEFARQELEPLLYGELRKLAQSHMSGQEASHTLQSTALVHEAWMKLADPASREWENRHQFFALASRAMRSILVDHARARRAQKRGGGALRITIAEELCADETSGFDLVDLDEALSALHKTDPELGQFVELRFFGGMSNSETADHLGLSLRSVERGMKVAKLWLADRLGGAEAADQ